MLKLISLKLIIMKHASLGMHLGLGLRLGPRGEAPGWDGFVSLGQRCYEMLGRFQRT